MRVEFRKGVPEGCVKWLWANVGPGNLKPPIARSSISGYALDVDDNPDFGWFYERVYIPNEKWPGTGEGDHIPTITVKDEKLATLFALRWA